MKNILLIILIVFSSVALSQHNVFILDSDSSEWGTCSFESSPGKYISLGRIGNKNLDEMQNGGLLIEFDDFSINRSKSYFKQDTSFYFYKGFQKENGNYFLYGSLSDSIWEHDYHNFLYLCEIAPDFQMVWEKTYPVPEGYRIHLGNYLIDQSNCVVIFSSLLIIPYSNEHLYLNKFDQEGNLIATTFEPDYAASPYNDIILKPDGSGYFVIGGLTINNVRKNTFEVDTSLNIVNAGGCLGGNNWLGYPCSAKYLPDGGLFIVNSESQETPGAYNDLEVRITDEQFNTVKDTVIIDPDNVYTPVNEGVDYVYDDLIWTCTFNYYPPFWSGTEIFKVYLFDKEMNLKGLKVFGGDSRWWLIDVTATSDGGCIFTGIIREEGGTTSFDNDLYILKVMPEDVITNIPDLDIAYSEKIETFPNPVKDKFHVKGVNSNMKLTITSPDGKRLLTKDLIAYTENIINTSSLNSGIYFYTIMKDNQTIKTGKLIKH